MEIENFRASLQEVMREQFASQHHPIQYRVHHCCSGHNFPIKVNATFLLCLRILFFVACEYSLLLCYAIIDAGRGERRLIHALVVSTVTTCYSGCTILCHYNYRATMDGRLHNSSINDNVCSEVRSVRSVHSHELKAL